MLMRRPLPARPFGPHLILLALAVVACEEVVVQVVEIAVLEVTPRIATLPVEDEVQLTASLRDGAGNVLNGREIRWSSAAPTVAAVSADGRVTAIAPGVARIVAAAEGVTDSATITVEARPAIALDRDAVGFAATVGEPDPEPAMVQVSNAGGGALGGLTFDVAYASGQPTGWLMAEPSGTAAPATLTLRASAASLPPGTYGATVAVAAPAAVNSPRSVAVTLTVSAGSTPPPPPPAAPSNLVAAPTSSTQINLSWTDQSGDEIEFRIERRAGAVDFAWIATVPAGVTVYSDIGLSPETAYAYRVRACHAVACSAYSNEATATTLSTPAIALSDTLVVFAAIEGGDDPAAAVVQVTNAGGETLNGLSASVFHAAGQPAGWLAAALASGTAPTTLTLQATTGALPSGTYAATVVVASAVASNTPRAVAVTFTLSPAPPGPPLDLTATPASPSRIDLAWTDTSAAEATFILERRPGAGGDWTVIDTLAANTTAYADSGLTAATTYGYRVRACNAGGCSEYSNIAEATTAAAPSIALGPDSVGFSAIQGGPAPAPAEVQVTNGGGGTLDSLAFEVVYAEGQPAGWLSGGLSATTAPATLKLEASAAGLDPGSYRATVVVASVAASNSPQAAVVTLTVAPPPVPTAPADFRATAVSSSQIDLSWRDTSAYTQFFRIDRRPWWTSNWTHDIAVIPVGTNGFQDTGLFEDTRYYYRIRACNATGCSDPVQTNARTQSDDG